MSHVFITEWVCLEDTYKNVCSPCPGYTSRLFMSTLNEKMVCEYGLEVTEI